MLFPIANDTDASVTTVVGSPVLAATVGPGLNFSGLEEPVRILLRKNELEVSAGWCVRGDCMFVKISLAIRWTLPIYCNIKKNFARNCLQFGIALFCTECHKWTASMCLLGF